MKYNFGTLESVALTNKEFVEVEVEETFPGQITYVQAWKFILFLLGKPMSLITYV
jgi:hypothetical protein